MMPPSGALLFNALESLMFINILYFTELQKGFDQWDYLIEGEDDNLIPGTNIDTTNH